MGTICIFAQRQAVGFGFTSYVSLGAALKLWFVHLREGLTETGRTSRNHTAITPLRETEVKKEGCGGRFYKTDKNFYLPFLFFLLSIIPSPYGAPNPSSHKRLKDRNLEQPEVEDMTSERERTEKEKENTKTGTEI